MKYLEGRCRIVFPSKFGIGDMDIDVSSTVERSYRHVEWRRRIGAFMVLMDPKNLKGEYREDAEGYGERGI